jgi:hypothetical protein
MDRKRDDDLRSIGNQAVNPPIHETTGVVLGIHAPHLNRKA